MAIDDCILRLQLDRTLQLLQRTGRVALAQQHVAEAVDIRALVRPAHQRASEHLLGFVQVLAPLGP